MAKFARLVDLAQAGMIRGVAAARGASGRAPGDRVVCMHETGDGAAFEHRMGWLADRYELVSLENLAVEIGDSDSTRRARVALTFDDGYRSWFEIAAPVLEALGLPATFFVCSGFVDTEGAARDHFLHERLRRTARLAPLTSTQLRALAEHALFDIGGHGATHADLGCEHVDLEAEIGRDRARISDWIGADVCRFAYPFGAPDQVTSDARAYLEQSGFIAAFTTVPGHVDTRRPFEVGRTMIEVDAPDATWAAMLDGGWDAGYRAARRMHALGRKAGAKQ